MKQILFVLLSVFWLAQEFCSTSGCCINIIMQSTSIQALLLLFLNEYHFQDILRVYALLRSQCHYVV